MALVASVLSTQQIYGLALPLKNGDGIPTTDTPPDEAFLWFTDVQPTVVPQEQPFGADAGIGMDGTTRHISLQSLTLVFANIGIDRTSNGQTPTVPAGQEAFGYLYRPTMQGIIEIIYKALTEFDGNIWINHKKIIFTNSNRAAIDPASITEANKWYKDLCITQLPEPLSGGFIGMVIQGFALSFYGFGKAAAAIDADATGGESDPPPFVPEFTGDAYYNGFGVGSFGVGDFGVGEGITV